MKIAKKHTGISSLTWEEMVDTVLCFGWIDGQRRGFDDSYFLQRATPRRPRSAWSQVNVDKAEALIAAGRMRPRGLAEVEAARADGRWEMAYASQKSATAPPESSKPSTRTLRRGCSTTRSASPTSSPCTSVSSPPVPRRRGWPAWSGWWRRWQGPSGPHDRPLGQRADQGHQGPRRLIGSPKKALSRSATVVSCLGDLSVRLSFRTGSPAQRVRDSTARTLRELHLSPITPKGNKETR